MPSRVQHNLSGAIQALRQRRATLVPRVAAVLEPVADRTERFAKDHAPWADDTGRARAGLHAGVIADEGAQTVTLFVAHDPDVDYAIHLETKYGGRDGIIRDALFAAEHDIRDTLKNG